MTDGKDNQTRPNKTGKKIAVALHYDNESAPVVTAKGEGLTAQKIEDLAHEAGVPIEENPMMAEALSQIEIDEEIPMELYQAAAVLIGFILKTGRAMNEGETGTSAE